jgi:hypothetical protein
MPWRKYNLNILSSKNKNNRKCGYNIIRLKIVIEGSITEHVTD